MPKTLGLVADPVVVAETVERTVPDVSARLRGDWHVHVDEQTFAAGQELRELSQRAEQLADEHGWDAVIGRRRPGLGLRVPGRGAPRRLRRPRAPSPGEDVREA
ncbi:MAG TPA: hypothetical protein VLK58_05035 [Conexibacter sp.]|nr:hypothetical protein [Conexibacter sp.]